MDGWHQPRRCPSRQLHRRDDLGRLALPYPVRTPNLPARFLQVSCDDAYYSRSVYYQDAKLNLVEKAWDGKGWYQGGFHVANKVPRAPLGVTSWGEGNSLGIRVYYGTVSNVIKEKGWDGSSGGWYDGGFSQESVPGSRVCAIPLDILRVYIQNGTLSTAVTEFAWEGKWVVGKDALPPA